MALPRYRRIAAPPTAPGARADDPVLVDLYTTVGIIERAEDELRFMECGRGCNPWGRACRALIDLGQARAKLASILQRIEAR